MADLTSASARRKIRQAERWDEALERSDMTDKWAAVERQNQPHADQASQFFADVANATARAAGRALTFLLAVGLIVVWAITGPLFGYSDTWQLLINTGTTVVTFLMVFLIQNSQNRDSAAIQVKLDELIRVSTAKNYFVGIEHLTDKELEELRDKCEARAKAESAGVEPVKRTARRAKRAANNITN